MFKLDRKLIIAATALSLTALFATGCCDSDTDASHTAPDIAGGVIYPIVGNKTGPYYVNDTAHDMTLNHGRVPNAAELKAWNTDVMAGYVYRNDPTALGMPEGSGSVEEGEEIYEAQCVSCHGDFGSGGGGYPSLSKGNAEELQKTLTNNRYRDPEAEGPTRVFGSYWPQASTMWWYIRDGMPHPFSKSLSDDETYALTAYMLNINEMSIDGVEVDDEYVLDRAKFIKVVMPNENGFEPNVKGPNALVEVRKYFANPANYGSEKVKASERCMTDCQEKSAKIMHIEHGGISSFTPPLSAVRDLPNVEAKPVDVKEAYANACAMCHDGFLSVGDEMWAGYTAKGMDKVYENGIHGTATGMPAKGGSSLS
ncbi:c-type cytochrome, partial [Sulfurimonas sp. SAG-AH-194-I05]